MQIISATKTAKETILNRKRNLFGLGLTSLIAACGDKAAGGGAAVDDGGDDENPPVGDIGDRPANPVPAKLSVTAGQLAEASGEKLAPVADIDSDHISASPAPGSDDSPTGGSNRSTLNDLVVTIDAASGLVDNNVEITFKNGDHDTADPFASVYQLADAEAGKHDLVVASADFGYSDGGKTSAIYIFWDIGSRTTTATFDNTDDNNFMRILGSAAKPIGQYAPNFFHIGGVDDAGDKPRYDMILGADGTFSGGNVTYMYIVWDVTQYVGANSENLFFSRNSTFTYMDFTSNANVNMNIYAPEFFRIGGEAAHHDMVIRGVGENSNDDRIYIVWDVANPDLNNKSIGIGSGATNGAVILNIYLQGGGNKIASYAPEFSHIGGDDSGGAQYDMVIRLPEGDKGAIYILWDAAKYSNASGIKSVILADTDIQSIAADYGLLRITGATGENIDKHSPEFLQIGGAVGASQQDMIIRSDDGATIYILWDVAAYYSNITIGDIDNLTFAVDLSNDTTITNGLLKITGENIGTYSPEFWQIAGTATQEDMVIRSDTAIYVLWDVAAYYSAASTPIDLSSTSIANGLLTITGATATDNIGQNASDILKINNNDDYDMIIKSDTDMYVLWDFTKYYSAATPANISLTDASATNGLLTISGGNTADVLKKDDGSFDDIDGKGINDLVFTDGGNTFILFGEQLAYRDDDGKAVSHEVDLTGINSLDFGGSAGFFTADAVVTPATKADLAEVIGYRFADTETDIGTVKADYEALFNSLPSAELSGADAGAGVWDIA